jgi:hypothetical protein
MAALKSWLFGSKPRAPDHIIHDEVPTSETTEPEPEPEVLAKEEIAEDRETLISAPPARKRTRFIYAAGEEEDEISGDVGSPSKSAKRARVTTGRRPKGKVTKPKTPPTPSSVQPPKEVTPRRREKKTEPTMMTPQSMDYAENERAVRESIEKDLDGDLGETRLSLGPEVKEVPALVQHGKTGGERPHDEEHPTSDDQGTSYLYIAGEEDSTSALSPSQTVGYYNYANNADFYSDNTSSSSEGSEDSKSEEGSVKPLRIEQKLLNVILEARDEFTLMPSTWAMHFRGYPVPPSIFYTKVKDISSRPRIYARTDKLEYNGTFYDTFKHIPR